MNTLGLVLTATLILMTNGATFTMDDMKQLLGRDVLWVKYRSYMRTSWARDVKCEYFEVAKSKQKDQYILSRGYSASGQWKKELLKGYVTPATKYCPGPVLQMMSSVISTHENYCLVYWNPEERCAIMKPTGDLCEIFVGDKSTGTSISACEKMYDQICGNGKYEVYQRSCLPYWKRITTEAHKLHLHQVLARLSRFDLVVNCPKTELGVTKLDFLGHDVVAYGIRPLRTRVTAMRNKREPQVSRGHR
nr:uncharacterized protein LOC129384623 [Dermacentor andersoni]